MRQTRSQAGTGMKMKWPGARSLAFVAAMALSQIALVGQTVAQTTPPDELMTVTLYSPIKYKLTDAAPLANGQLRGDHRRAHLDLITGEFHGRPALTYGAAYLGQDLDWFDVADENDRTVIRDLGKINWNDKFKIPVVAALPELRPGERRRLVIDTSGKDGRNGIDGANGAPGLNGGEGPRESVMGAEPGANGRPTTDPSEVWHGPSRPSGAATRKTKLIISLPVMAKAVLGHMYAIHVVNPQSDFYVLVHVDGLVAGDNCTISWKRIPSP
jgi:hypothetical protein